jgi:uncharacterized membrane protein YqjE
MGETASKDNFSRDLRRLVIIVITLVSGLLACANVFFDLEKGDTAQKAMNIGIFLLMIFLLVLIVADINSSRSREKSLHERNFKVKRRR